MPRYVFECQNQDCNCRFERVLKMGDHPMHPCPSCREDAPRCIEGEGFAFGFKQEPAKEGNSGVHKEDYPTADHAVGRSAERRWATYDERRKVKEQARAAGGTHALQRQDAPSGDFVEYVPMSGAGLDARKQRAARAFEAIRVAKEARQSR